MVMPEHLLRCHPFLGQSHFNPTFADEEVDSECHRIDARCDGYVESEGDTGNDDIATSSADVPETAPVEEGPQSTGSTFSYDRRSTFVINDASCVGNNAYFSRKEFKVKVQGERGDSKREQVTAVAIRESGTAISSKEVRFLYCTPIAISRGIENWLALPRSNSSDTSLLFSKTVGQEQHDPQILAMEERF